MNIMLIDKSDLSGTFFKVKGRRFEHIKTVLKAKDGDSVKCGIINDFLFNALILKISDNDAEFQIIAGTEAEPPPPLKMTLIMALSRPKSFRKALHAAVSSGIKKIYVINSWKVDKSYWTSPLLSGAELEEEIILALEQSCDSIMPDIHFKRLFKPFVEDEIPGIIANRQAYLADPAASETCPFGIQGEFVLAIGPEGGFTPYESDMLIKSGLRPVNIGRRILRVEVAVPFLTGRTAQ